MRRFTLRDLFWLTLVVAMGVGWWVDRGRVVAERQAMSEAYDMAHALAGSWKFTVTELVHILKSYGVDVSLDGPVIVEWSGPLDAYPNLP